MDPDRYDFLDCKRYVIRRADEKLFRHETLAEIEPYRTVELYTRERIRALSHQGLVQTELRRLLGDLVGLRREHPEGSNQECMCMDAITELIGKLDLDDFRTLRIERIVDEAQTS